MGTDIYLLHNMFTIIFIYVPVLVENCLFELQVFQNIDAVNC